jgi:hypothetical protein
MILPSMILLFFFVASRLRVRLSLPPRDSKATVARPFFLSELDAKIALAGLGISGRYFPPS